MLRRSLAMLFAAIVLALAVSSAVANAAEEDGEGTSVQVLTDQNFEHLTQASTGATTGDWFIKFYTDWCGHCKRLQPTWEAIAKKHVDAPDYSTMLARHLHRFCETKTGLVPRYQGKLNIAEVDCQHAGQNTCMRFGIRSYPSIKFMRHGRVYDYVGKDRSEAELARYLDGAWEDAPAAPVPPPYSALNLYKTAAVELYDKVARSLEVNAKQHPEFLVINSLVMFLVGMLTMGILACVCNSTAGLDEKPRKTVKLPRHALKTTDTEDESEDDSKPAADKKDD